MQTQGKKLVIISGVTGAIGSQFFDLYGREEGTIVYGISRKGIPYQSLLTEQGVLPARTGIFSTGSDDFDFVRDIDFKDIGEVIYIHALGLYPFEVNKHGEHQVENDVDGDGVNDECERLTFKLFSQAVEELQSAVGQGPFTAVIFGGLADAHRPLIHQSWWKTIEKTKGWAREFVRTHGNTKIICANISSVLCPHEVITRPFVFIKTDADPRKWLSPHELATFLAERIPATPSGFSELEHFLFNGAFDPRHYTDEQFTPRKVRELF